MVRKTVLRLPSHLYRLVTMVQRKHLLVQTRSANMLVSLGHGVSLPLQSKVTYII